MDSENLLMQASILELVDRRARWLRQRLRGSAHDLDDIKQELRLALLQRVHEFREDRVNLEAFTYNVLHGKACKLIRRQLAKKRRDLRKCEQGLDFDPRTNYTRLRTGGEANPQTVLELQLDVQQIVQRMPESLRQIAEAMMNSPDLATAARSLNISTRTILRAKGALRRWLSCLRE